jgi:hypothetical protein
MPSYIMDTDHTSYILRGDSSVIENAKFYGAAITIITVQLQFKSCSMVGSAEPMIQNKPID